MIERLQRGMEEKEEGEGERYRSMERVDVDCRVRRRRGKVVTGGKDAEDE
jgi:hypothetical protein